MPSDTDRIAGKSGYFIYQGKVIPFTKYTPKVTRKLGDTTDSADYSQFQDMIGTTQIPCTYTIEGSVEGRFRRSSTPAFLISNSLDSLSQIFFVFGLNFLTGESLYSGRCDLSDFQTDVPVDDIVTFTANIRSWGIIAPNTDTGTVG